MKNKENLSVIKKIYKDFVKKRSKLIFIVICFFASATLLTITPKITGETLTEVYNQLVNKIAINGRMDFGKINILLIMLVLIYISVSIIDYIKNVFLINATQKYIAELRNRIHRKILNIPINKIYNNGEILSILTNDIENINTCLMRTIREAFSQLLNITGAIIMIYTINPVLLGINIIVLIIGVIILELPSKVSRKHYINKQKKIADLNNKVEEIYDMHSTIKLSNYDSFIHERFDKDNEEICSESIKSEFIASIAGPGLFFLENFTIIIITIISAILNIAGQIEVGYIYTLISYTKTITSPLNRMGWMVNDFMNILVSAKRIYNFLEIDEEEITEINEFKETLQGQNVYFSYEKEEELLKNINIDIKNNNIIAIVGKTGSGKSTLVKLLMKIYSIDSGEISIDENNINKLNTKGYQRNFSLVSQDINLFTDTIMENIKYGNSEVTEKDIIKIAKEIGIHEIFETLENGYNTKIKENDNISSGIKQLIALMQCIVSKAKIIVFDEATNKLDEEVSKKIEKAINKIKEYKTIIIITHNPKEIKEADCIYVMDDGKIVEYGTHQDLLAKEGKYAEMFKK